MDGEHEETLIEKQFGQKSLYEILEVQKDASLGNIKKAFRKCALKHHPDKGGDAEKFKALCAVHAVLSDENRRKIYDDTGTISGDSPVSGDGTFQDWYDYFRAMFPPLTTKDITDFSSKYRMSEEERDDVIQAYKDTHGCLNDIMQKVLLAEREDVSRFRVIIEKAIKNGNIEETKLWRKTRGSATAGIFDDESGMDVVSDNDNGSKATSEDGSKKRKENKKKNTKKEKSGSPSKVSSVGMGAKKTKSKAKPSKSRNATNDELDLGAMILQNQQNRAASFANILNKYSGGKGPNELTPPDIPDSAFAEVGSRLR
jgi:DnaJ homolog subfamily C member 9